MGHSFWYLVAMAIIAKATTASRDVRFAGGSGWQDSGGIGSTFPAFGATGTSNQWSRSGNWGGATAGGWSGTPSFGSKSQNGFSSGGSWGTNGQSPSHGYGGNVRSSTNSGGWAGSETSNKWDSPITASRPSSGWQASSW